MRTSGVLAVSWWVLGSGNAFGQTTPEPAPAPSAPVATQPQPGPSASQNAPLPTEAAARQLALWQKSYLFARERLMAGDFVTASGLFSQLARTAPNPTYHAVAVEQWRMAAQWAGRGLVLVQRSDLGESTIAAKAADERTTDELAVLYLNSVFYGLGTGGFAAVQTEPQTTAGGILPALGLAGASAGLVAVLDSGRPLRYGVPQSIVTGMYLGLEEGILWTFWNQASVSYSDEWNGKTMAGVIWGFTTAGALAGGIIGQTAGTTPGRASFVGSAALWSGAVMGMAVGAAVDLDHSDTADDKALLAAALGLNAGAVGGVLAAGPVSPTVARIRYVDLGGIAGGLLGGGLYLAAAEDSNDSGRAFLGVTALGVTGGLVTSWILTRGMPQDRRAIHPAETKVVTSWSPRLLPTQHGIQLGAGGLF